MTLRERLDSIIERKAEGVAKMKALLEKADEEKRDLTEDETKEYDAADKAVEALKADEVRTQKLLANELEMAQPERQIRTYIRPMNVDNPREWRNLGEFIHAVRFNQSDPRLQDAYNPNVGQESRQQSMGVGAEGGFAVPDQFLNTVMMVDPQQAIFRPRCTVLPAGNPPDATLEIPALDQGAAQNMYGGMGVTWIAEAGTKAETDMALRQICLTPHEVAGHVVITDKLIRNWAGASAMVERMMRLCVTGATETAYYSGSGVGQPLGIINSPARIDVGRGTAGAVLAADIDTMYSRAKFGGSLVWIASQTILPQLTAMVHVGGTTRIWIPQSTGTASAIPGTLYGIPLMFSDRSVALGTRGDLVLADLAYYLIKDGSGPFVATSEHVHFTTNRTVIKIFWNVDGQPWLDAPIQLEGAAAGNTVSPFVVLN